MCKYKPGQIIFNKFYNKYVIRESDYYRFDDDLQSKIYVIFVVSSLKDPHVTHRSSYGNEEFLVKIL